MKSDRQNSKEIKMKYYDLLKSIQNIANGVVPDLQFLSSLQKIPKKDLAGFNLPKELEEFFTQIGLPEKIQFIREPEEIDTPEIYFPIHPFVIRKIEQSEYLSFGGWREEDKLSGVTCKEDKCQELRNTYEGEYLIDIDNGSIWYVDYLDLKQTGDVWYFTDSDLGLQFVNSSIEQFVLSMACWKSFYFEFEKKYLEIDGDLEYIFSHDELYEPFRNTMRILDARALEGEVDHWSFMCDLSLY